MYTPFQYGLMIFAATLVAMLVTVFIRILYELKNSSVRGPLPLKLFRSNKQGVADLLQWAALVDSGVVMTKGGGLLSGYWFRGADTASSTASERNYISARVNAALARMGDGWVTWTECVRVEAKAYPDELSSHFPDRISAAIEDERRAYFTQDDAHFVSDYVLMVMYTPPRREESKLAELIYDDDVVGEELEMSTRLMQQFNRALSDLEDSLHGTIKLQRMRSYEKLETSGSIERPVLYDEVVNFLNYCLSGLSAEVVIPPTPMYLDAYIGGQELFAGITPRYGERFICCVSIEGFPDVSRPNILSFLDSLRMPYRWSTRFIYLGQQTALQELNRYRRKWRQKQRGFIAQVFRIQSGQVNEDALLMARQADAAITDAQSAMVTFGYYTSVIVMTDVSRSVLEENARVIVRELRRQGFNGRVETINTMQAWAGSLPGHAEPNIRRPVLHTLNLADLLPLSSVWAGREFNPCPFYPPESPPVLHAATTGATPFRFNLHVGDVGHTLVLGPTGSGKSTLLCTLVAQFMRYKDATVAAFDNGRSMFALCEALGGQFYDLAGEDSQLGLAPLQFLDTDTDVAWAAEWLAACFELQSAKRVSPVQMQAISRALSLMRQNPQGRSLTDFSASVQDQQVRAAIAHYTLAGPLGKLLDAKEDGLKDGRLQVFEISELMAMGNANLLPVLLYLFRRVEKMRRGQPMLVPLDEAWVVLGHPVFREKLRDWLKTMRRSNVAIVPATQSLSDALRSGIMDVLIESCPTKIFLANDEADKKGTPDSPGPNDLYRLFGLNDQEIGILKSAQKKRHYYFRSVEGRRLFELALGPLTLSFVGVSDKESIARIRSLMKQHGQAWPGYWLKERGLAGDVLKAA